MLVMVNVRVAALDVKASIARAAPFSTGPSGPTTSTAGVWPPPPPVAVPAIVKVKGESGSSLKIEIPQLNAPAASGMNCIVNVVLLPAVTITFGWIATLQVPLTGLSTDTPFGRFNVVLPPLTIM